MKYIPRALASMNSSRWTIPRDEEYFTLFESLSQAAKKAAETLADYSLSKDAKHAKIVEIERAGDDIEQATLEKLNMHIDPPLKGRSNIRGLVRNLDNIIDQIKRASKRMLLADIASETFKEQAVLLVQATTVIEETLPLFRELRQGDNEKRICVASQKLSEIEAQGDRLYEETLTSIEEGKRKCEHVREWHVLDRKEEVVTMLENALNQCEDVGSFMDSLKLENV